MKIIAILENEITSGGGFNQALNAILQMKRICQGRFEFEVLTTRPENLPHLKILNLNAHVFTKLFLNRWVTKLNTSKFRKIIPSHFKLVSPLEQKLLDLACDLAYFVTPDGMSISLQKLNYISTIWDLCHLDAPIFPEVRGSVIATRELRNRNNLDPAVLILTDSARLAQIASTRYGIDLNRFLPMPFAPSPFLAATRVLSKEEVLKKYCLKSGYYFYPAQFWAHKNHIRILEALLLLKNTSLVPKVVFTGKDYGNRDFLEGFVKEHGLQEQVIFLGFVPTEDMHGLYEGAWAVTMPTYFGPTNLPPLEAWSLSKPLIYSAHLAEQVADAALLIDPNDAAELADAMIKCNKLEVRMQLVEAGKRRLQFIAHERTIAENELLKKLDHFATQRRCWR
jgi:glycosyltransferase involved in cell wall biosynthesis